jgi:hypothetical protein
VERLWVVQAEGTLYRSHGGASLYLLLLGAVAAVVLASVGYYLWNTSRKSRDARGEEATPEDILAELCRAHELTRAEQSLISLLARNDHLPQPASVFIDPRPLDRAAEAADPDAPRYVALRQKLFGGFN